MKHPVYNYAETPDIKKNVITLMQFIKGYEKDVCKGKISPFYNYLFWGSKKIFEEN